MSKKHAELLKRIDRDFDQANDNQTESYDDRRFAFVAGAQWDGKVGRQFANRPKFEFNKILLSVTRIYNEWAKNQFAVQFRPDQHPADDETADSLNSLIRGDERDSNADEAYSNAFIEGISGGIGAFMMVAEYEYPFDDDNDQQRIRIKPIFEADTCVYWDADAKRYDKADANHVTVVVRMGREEFKRKYGKDDSDIDAFDALDAMRFDWVDGDGIKVAEHYEVSETKRKIIKLQHEHEDEPVTLYQDGKDYEQQLDDYLARGFSAMFEKTIKQRQIRGYVLSGSEIIEDLGVIAGDYLPVIPYYGKRSYISGREVTQGHVRLARDAQKAYNIKMSSLIDLASRPQDELPIFTPEQIKDHAMVWARKEVDKPAFLTINPLYNIDGSLMAVGPQAYTKSPQIPPALSAIIQQADADIHELTGNQANGEQLVSNVSTEAVELVQDKVDAQSYIYIHNWGKTIQHAGRVWLSIAQAIYDEPMRKMTGVTHDDQDKAITINEPTIRDGRQVFANDMQSGKYRVLVDVGEAFATQRDRTIKQLVNILPIITDPQTQLALANTILANQDGEGLRDLAKFARKQLVVAGVVEPNDDEAAELQQAQMAAANQPPDAQTLWMQAEAQKATAQAEKQKADTQKTLAQVDESRANTAKTLFELEQGQAQQAATMQAMLQILQAMQQQQQQQGEQIKQEVSGKGGELPPEAMAQLQQQMGEMP